ncbi:MAG: hypothetical protein OJF51_001648 [Nitrospira sp.]|nr:MAG: hypothetical protein OJF51_001648 [Nitrospira sp.]
MYQAGSGARSHTRLARSTHSPAFDDRARNAVARVPRRLTPVVVGLATDQRTFALQEGDR